MRQGFVFSMITLAILCAPVLGVGGDMGVSTEPLTDGSETYPWLIEDLADFDTFAGNSAYWAAGIHTKLMTDIDLTGRTYTTAVIAPDTDTETYWFQGTPFTGLFDGSNKTIHHFYVNQPDVSHIAIFGGIETGGKVSNLNITDVNIIGYDYIAGLAGHIDNATIENCSVSGTLRCTGYTAGGLVAGAYTSSTINSCQSAVTIHSVGHTVGGLIGENNGSSVINCHSWATVSGDWANLGGLIGTNYGGTIVNCSSEANIFITDPYVDYVGGLLGYSSGGLISSSWSNSQTTGTSYVGGLIGCTNSSCIIENSYSNGQVNGVNYVGGLVGRTSWSSNETFAYCYSNCLVSGDFHVGGLLGEKTSNISLTGCFWDTESSGTVIAYFLRSDSSPYTYAPIYNTPGIAEGKTTIEMKMQSTFTGWDFTDEDGDAADWWMPSTDYPQLPWQPKITYGGQASISLVQHDTDTLQVDIYSLIDDTLIWTLDGYDSCEWITNVDPNSGSSNGPTDKTIANIEINTASMDIGDYTCELVLSANTSNSIRVPITLHIYNRVDLEEFAFLAQYWLLTGCDNDQPCAKVDWYIDGVIDINDIAQMSACWMGETIRYMPPTKEDFETGNFTVYPWQHSGDANWSIVSDVVFRGTYAAKSGTITDNQNSSIEITLETSPENISFYRKVSSETDYDFLRFYIDGIQRACWSGEQEWEQQFFSITPGSHTFKWSYTKDSSASGGSDCAWIDEIVLY